MFGPAVAQMHGMSQREAAAELGRMIKASRDNKPAEIIRTIAASDYLQVMKLLDTNPRAAVTLLRYPERLLPLFNAAAQRAQRALAGDGLATGRGWPTLDPNILFRHGSSCAWGSPPCGSLAFGRLRPAWPLLVMLQAVQFTGAHTARKS